MRVLFMNSMKASGWRGGEKWMVEAAAGLSSRGHAVFLAVRPGSVTARKAEERDVRVVPTRYGPDIDPILAARLGRLLSRERIELVCTNFEKENRLIAQATLAGRRPVLVARKGLPYVFDKWRYRVIYRHWVRHIVTPSHSIERRLRSLGWLDGVGITVIPNGVRVEEYQTQEPAGLRRRLGIGRDVPLIGFVGDLARQKGVDVLLRALPSLPGEWRLVLVGDGGERRNLQRLAGELGIERRTLFAGHRDDVPRVLSELDAVVLPSRFEGMPNALLEAMAAGKAVVASDVDGIREVLSSESLGRRVPPEDPEALRAALAELLANEALRRRLGEAAQEHARRNFSAETMVGRLEKLFSELIGTGR